MYCRSSLQSAQIPLSLNTCLRSHSHRITPTQPGDPFPDCQFTKPCWAEDCQNTRSWGAENCPPALTGLCTYDTSCRSAEMLQECYHLHLSTQLPSAVSHSFSQAAMGQENSKGAADDVASGLREAQAQMRTQIGRFASMISAAP